MLLVQRRENEASVVYPVATERITSFAIGNNITAFSGLMYLSSPEGTTRIMTDASIRDERTKLARLKGLGFRRCFRIMR